MRKKFDSRLYTELQPGKNQEKDEQRDREKEKRNIPPCTLENDPTEKLPFLEQQVANHELRQMHRQRPYLGFCYVLICNRKETS
jgi:hypothetical protein